jgi:hypothetical protein
MRRGYDPGYGSREQLKDCQEQGMKAARERDTLKAENAALLDCINKLTWQSEQYKTLLVCMRHFMNCDGANECRTCITTADMYLELMA